MSRRDFLDAAQKFAAVVGLTAAVQLEMLRPERNIERGTDHADHVQIGRRCHFRFWRECEVPRRPLNRRYRAKSGSDADIAKPTRLTQLRHWPHPAAVLSIPVLAPINAPV